MRFITYIYQKRTNQGKGNQAYIRVRVWGSEIEQGEQKCEVKWKHEMRGGMEFGDGRVNGLNMMMNRMEEWNGGTC